MTPPRAAVIFTDNKGSFSPTVYLHWNGGPESIYAFLDELDRREVRADQEYEAARFIGIVSEFFDQDSYGGTSLGVSAPPASGSLDDLGSVEADFSDNGIYLVDRTGKERQVRRVIFRRYEDCQDYEDYKNNPLRELTPEEVEAERTADPQRMAEYAEAIATVYANKPTDRELWEKRMEQERNQPRLDLTAL